MPYLLSHYSDQDLQVKIQLQSDTLRESNLNTQVRLAYDGLIAPL